MAAAFGLWRTVIACFRPRSPPDSGWRTAPSIPASKWSAVQCWSNCGRRRRSRRGRLHHMVAWCWAADPLEHRACAVAGMAEAADLIAVAIDARPHRRPRQPAVGSSHTIGCEGAARGAQQCDVLGCVPCRRDGCLRPAACELRRCNHRRSCNPIGPAARRSGARRLERFAGWGRALPWLKISRAQPPKSLTWLCGQSRSSSFMPATCPRQRKRCAICWLAPVGSLTGAFRSVSSCTPMAARR